jgi:hypothetical protein
MKYLEDSPLALTQAELEDAHAVNITSAYLAAAESMKGFESLPKDAPKSFIYTGNGFNQIVMPANAGLGIESRRVRIGLRVLLFTMGPRVTREF